jgi:hemerythrin-like domain-containing protein
VTTHRHKETAVAPDTLAPPDVSSFLRAHACFRRDLDRFARLVAGTRPVGATRAAAVRAYWNSFVQLLDHHHQAEDDLILPVVAADLPDGAELVSRLESQHGRLCELLETVTPVAAVEEPGSVAGERSRAGMTELAELLTAHLDEEDEELVPAFARCFDADRWRELDRRIVARLEADELYPFALPWTADGLRPTLMDRALARLGAEVRRAYYEVWLPRYAAQTRLVWGEE